MSYVWVNPQCCTWHRFLNWIDVRYWGCECYHDCKYGFVVQGGCQRHD